MSNKLNNTEASADDVFSNLLAQKLRRERTAKNWSIAELALASGVSKAMISKIERAETSPTAALLGRISGAFGISISNLLASAEADRGNNRVIRNSDQEIWQDPETGYIRRALTPPGAEPEMISIELPPEASITYPSSSYGFVKGHCVWVMSGRLEITEAGETTDLRKGDCYVFDLSQVCERTYTNPTQSQIARYIVSLTHR